MSADDNWVRELDARQRAMLGEMGVKLWLPRSEAAARSQSAASVRAGPPPEAVVAIPAVQAGAPAREAASTPAHAPAPRQPQAAPVARGRDGIETLDWPALREAVANCRACGLCASRRNTVFGVGDTQADWMIVGEAPGENEDRQGEPFVGAAGQLLDAMLRACGRSRSNDEPGRSVFIANVLKCRPPANRNPAPEEVLQCEPFLARQVALVQPKLVIAMGRFAVQSLLGTTEPIGRLRGQVHRYQGVPVIVTYHPAYLLRTPADKAKAWADLCRAMDLHGPD